MAPAAAAVWQRNPRYTVLLVVILFGALYLLDPYHRSSSGLPSYITTLDDPTLPERVAFSDVLYDQTLKDRAELIKKRGPNTTEIETFPENKRVTLWDYFPATFNCPHELERIGVQGDGGKWVCGLSRIAAKKNCVIYSVGINYESSFEAEMLANTEDCQLWGYDFSVLSFGPQMKDLFADRAHFYRYGLSGSDQAGPDDNIKMYTLQTLMEMNGHTHIDILKIDIEGYEFETLETLIKYYQRIRKPLPFSQLQLEIHVGNQKTFPEFLKWWEMLEEAGLRPFFTEPNMVCRNGVRLGITDLTEYSFLNRHGENVFLSDPA